MSLFAFRNLPSRHRWLRAVVLGGTVTLFLLPSSPARAADGETVVAVYSSISPDYSRSALPDGSFKPEFYAFGEGGRLNGVLKDGAIDDLRFIDIAKIIAPSLAAQNYFPCDTAKPRDANLLVMVYWGTTIGTDKTSSSSEYQIAQSLVPPPLAGLSPPPTGGSAAMVSDPSTSGRQSEGEARAAVLAGNNSALDQSLLLATMANRQRDRQNIENATIIGYLPELKRVEGYQMTAFQSRRQDLVNEIEESRYYVVLLAYDFQLIMKNKQRKLLWETRFSIPERHNNFSKELAAMATTAARYYGQNSDGLTRRPIREGQVILGELKEIGLESETSPSDGKTR